MPDATSELCRALGTQANLVVRIFDASGTRRTWIPGLCALLRTCRTASSYTTKRDAPVLAALGTRTGPSTGIIGYVNDLRSIPN